MIIAGMCLDLMIDAYSAVADLYIDLFGAVAKTDPGDLAFITRHLSIPGGVVLDLGCGPGHLTGHLRSLGVAATGIDLVPEFIAYARATHPDGDYRLGSMASLDAEDGSVAGILAWFSLIHLPPDEIAGVLAEFRRVLAPGGTLVAGFFEAPELGPFDHKVTTAYRWPADEFAARLARSGFTEFDRDHRPGTEAHRPYGMIAARRA